MTVQQVVEWIEHDKSNSEETFKEKAILLNGQALQIISGIGSMLDKHTKFLTLEKMYPDLFGVRSKIKNMSPEEIENATICAWHNFLGV